MKYVVVSLLTAMYSIFWVMLLFMIVGFFMPNPAKFARAISGSNKKRKYKATPAKTDLEKDDYLFYETIDD